MLRRPLQIVGNRSGSTDDGLINDGRDGEKCVSCFRVRGAIRC